MNIKNIRKVATLLENSLPAIVTKEELMNHYLHKLDIRQKIDLDITVVNLVQAANLANIIVKGKSPLEVNVSKMEQWRYMTTEYKPSISKKDIRARLHENRNDIVAAYEDGATIKDLAYAFNVNTTTMHRYLNKFNAKMRVSGKKKLLGDTRIRLDSCLGQCRKTKKAPKS